MSIKALFALYFARFWHRGQRRRATGLPYHTHLDDVAGFLMTRFPQVAQERGTVIAAYLHDLYEDTKCPRWLVILLFGSKVHRLIVELTNVYTPEDFPGLNRSGRKALEHGRLSKVSTIAKAIKLCDCLDNTMDFLDEARTTTNTFPRIYAKEIIHLMDVFSDLLIGDEVMRGIRIMCKDILDVGKR